MYKKKYYKYKNKYLKLISGGDYDIPENIDPDDLDGLEELPIDEHELDLEAEEEIDSEMKEKASERGEFIGFDIDPGTDFINESLQQDIVDIGLKKNARGKIHLYSDFDPDIYIKLKDKSEKTKILIIDTTEDFDDFTIKYGFLDKNDNQIYISWEEIARKYKGIYISSSSQGDRDEDIPLGEKTTENWLDYDYNFIDDVIIFVKFRNLINFRKISKPFKGKIADDYAIDEKEFVRIWDPITHDKILLIDDIKSFDKLTNTYGVLIQKKEQYINMDWNSLNKDYDGFYLDRDADFYKRLQKAFYKGILYNSWVKKNGIEQGIVYLFD